MSLTLTGEVMVTPLDDRFRTPRRDAEDVIIGGRVRPLLWVALEEVRPDAKSLRIRPAVQGVGAIHGPFIVRHLQLNGGRG